MERRVLRLLSIPGARDVGLDTPRQAGALELWPYEIHPPHYPPPTDDEYGAGRLVHKYSPIHCLNEAKGRNGHCVPGTKYVDAARDENPRITGVPAGTLAPATLRPKALKLCKRAILPHIGCLNMLLLTELAPSPPHGGSGRR